MELRLRRGWVARLGLGEDGRFADGKDEQEQPSGLVAEEEGTFDEQNLPTQLEVT